MDVLWWVLGGLLFGLLLFLLWIFALCSLRRGHPAMKSLPPMFAHRGLHDGEKPENSLAAFEAAVKKGVGFEFDLHLTNDGKLVVMHDDSILRMCGKDLKVCALSLEELRGYPLPDGSPIPTFEEVLALAQGKVPLLIELKTDGNNGAALCEKTLGKLAGYKGDFYMESFDPRVLWALKRYAPQIPRGQLADNFLNVKLGSVWLRWLLTLMVANFLTRPDFVAYNIENRKALPIRILEKTGLPICFWTVRKKEELNRCLKKGQCAIFERLGEDLWKI